MTIRRLPQQVADAIAAGEVVERPASALKELIENALDAGSGRLGIEVRGAGRTLIRVVDDGAGIPAEELELAFQRHATSKVRSLADLEAISSLGFRGEALASLAAVADVECRSRGRRIRLLAGEVVESAAAVPVPGTVLEVRDLFANTPARLRFLKSDATELAACLKVVQAYSLLYPEVRFEYTNEGRVGLRTLGRGDATAAAAAVLGTAVAAELLPVEGEGIRGLTSQPRLHRGSRDSLLLAVNRRPIASRALGYAVEECYLGQLERGRYPIAVLELTVPPGELDVNVHPAKREVRFRDERVVFGRLQRAIRAALNGSQPYRMAEALSSAGSAWRTPQVHSAPAFAGLESVVAEAFPAAPGAEGPLRPLGQVQDAYLVAESGEGIVLVDQHAAHERVLYNRFLAQLRAGAGASQALLLPETVELEPAQTAAASDHRDWLAALGFELEEFGPQTVKLRAAPLATPAARAREALSELLQTLAHSLPQAALANAAASLACHSAVRFGDRLEPVEQRRLLEELEQAEESITCPHGRPTRLLLDWSQLKRHFRRNY
ncbi:MAG: DNA mismatch repair endonuclease MutL [Candidatus Dormibacter sp.]|uniref:DNA mismatch repair endonuclease MutL n=1 Tax=Candidatus Dormibacter sp. TaxID=2973982 RepID=UPI000DB065DD|nr:MAG: DNA mismatch repair endonuclease MutL [Candidatus Dormibacteraeota bacterium]